MNNFKCDIFAGKSFTVESIPQKASILQGFYTSEHFLRYVHLVVFQKSEHALSLSEVQLCTKVGVELRLAVALGINFPEPTLRFSRTNLSE